MNNTPLEARDRSRAHAPHRRPRLAFAVALLATTALGAADPALADSKLENRLPDRFMRSPGGVDMRSGRYMYSETDLTIGAEGQSGGLQLTRTIPNHAGMHANPFGNFSHNWDMMLMESRVDLIDGGSVGGDYRMNVHFGGRALTFESRSSDIGYQHKTDGAVATLTYTGDKANSSTLYTFTATDGTILNFRPIGSYDCAGQLWNGVLRRCAFVSEMIEADGTRFSFDYAYIGGAGNRARLRQVTSSRGYTLLLEGGGSRVTKACAINLTRAVPSADGLCPPDAPAATYSYDADGKLVAATDPTGAVSGFTYEPVNGHATMGFIKPGQSAPWLTNFIDLDVDEEENPKEVTVGQSFADGRSYTYVYSRAPMTNNKPNPAIAGGAYVDGADRETHVIYDFPVLPGTGCEPVCTQPPCSNDEPDGTLNYTYQQTPGPVGVLDPLQRATYADYCDPALMNGAPPTQTHRCAVGPIASFTDPEGIKTEVEHDGRGNITRTIQHPKPGQEALGTIVTSWTYSCINAKSCAKPTSTTDAKSNVTEFSYAPEHGGVLTETGPAVNGIRPQTRYRYAQRHAWIRSAAGGFVRAATPVWLLVRKSVCKTGAASGDGCANGAADEVVTLYDYGPDAGPNNLLLRGIVEDAGGLNARSCYAYDAKGNRTGETSPLAGLTSCN